MPVRAPTTSSVPGLVSVVIPTYNRADRLARAIRSCLAQTYPRVEILVVDDGSSDDTHACVDECCREAPDGMDVRYVEQAHQGACAARNLGMRQAAGEYIQFLDSDDVLHPTKFAKQIEALEQSGAAVAVCGFRFVQDGAPFRVLKLQDNHEDPRQLLVRMRSPWTAAPLIRRDSIPPDLVWNTCLTRHQDIDFLFRYFLMVRGWVHVAECLADYVIHSGERISDAYDRGIDRIAFARGYRCYWQRNRRAIPAENAWMLPAFMAEQLIDVEFGRDRRLLRAMALYSVRRPYRAPGMRRRALRMLIKSVLVVPHRRQ